MKSLVVWVNSCVGFLYVIVFTIVAYGFLPATTQFRIVSGVVAAVLVVFTAAGILTILYEGGYLLRSRKRHIFGS